MPDTAKLMTAEDAKGLGEEMKDRLPLIEVHTLRPTAGELLNRDFHGRHKTEEYGGVRRARFSSQSKRHAIRLAMEKKHADDIHTRALPQMIKRKLKEDGASQYCFDIVDGAFDSKEINKKNKALGTLTSQIVDVTKSDINAFVVAVYDAEKEYPDDPKKASAAIREKMEAESGIRRLPPLTALLGRMSTNPMLSDVESAVHMNHPYSVNPYAGDTDDYVACDDYLAQMGIVLRDDGEDVDAKQSGSAFMDTSDISANVYYEYVCIDERIFFENMCRGRREEDVEKIIKEVKQFTAEFIQECIFRMPSAKQNTMATFAEPAVVYITKGCMVYNHTPDSCFEKAIYGSSDRDVAGVAVDRLKKAIKEQKNGHFAINHYTGEYWISDDFDVPEGVQEADVKNLPDIV